MLARVMMFAAGGRRMQAHVLTRDQLTSQLMMMLMMIMMMVFNLHCDNQCSSGLPVLVYYCRDFAIFLFVFHKLILATILIWCLSDLVFI